MVIDCDLCGQREAACLADQNIPADFPMRARFALADQQVDFFFLAQLEPPEFRFYFADKIVKWRGGRDAGLPAKSTINQIVLLYDA